MRQLRDQYATATLPIRYSYAPNTRQLCNQYATGMKWKKSVRDTIAITTRLVRDLCATCTRLSHTPMGPKPIRDGKNAQLDFGRRVPVATIRDLYAMGTQFLLGERKKERYPGKRV